MTLCVFRHWSRSPSDTATTDWLETVEHVEREAMARQERLSANGHEPTLNRKTLEFIRDGAPELLYFATHGPTLRDNPEIL